VRIFTFPVTPGPNPYGGPLIVEFPPLANAVPTGVVLLTPYDVIPGFIVVVQEVVSSSLLVGVGVLILVTVAEKMLVAAFPVFEIFTSMASVGVF
jgi:hypothetical protein